MYVMYYIFITTCIIIYVYVHLITHVNVQYTVPIKTITNTCTEEHVVMGNTEKVHVSIYM